MNRPLRKYFPSVCISPLALAQLAGLEWKPGANFPCPQCNPSGESGVTLTAERDANGVWMLSPCSCGWSGSLFDHLMDSKHVTPETALRLLIRHGVKVPRLTRSPRILAAWVRDRETTQAMAGLAWRMARQRIPSPYFSHHLSRLGLTADPHHHPLWWTTTAVDLDHQIGRAAKPANAVSRRLGSLQHTETGHPTLAIPLWENERTLSGIVGLNPSTNHEFMRLRDGSTAAIAFLHTRHKQDPGWGNTGVIVEDPWFALRLITDGHKMGVNRPVAYVAPRGNPRVVANLLCNRPWTMISTSNLFTSRHFNDHEDVVFYFKLTRLLNAGFVSHLGPYMPTLGMGKSHLDGVINHAETYWRGLSKMIHSYLYAGQHGVGINNAIDLIHRVGVDSELLGHLQEELSRSSWDEIQRHIKPPPPLFRSVAVSEGFTVAESSRGWFWSETGELLTSAVPTAVQSYRGPNKKLRHRGVVVFAGQSYPFDTSRFHSEPARVIEAVLLRAGITDVPTPHPRIVPHLVAVSRYFSTPPQ